MQTLNERIDAKRIMLPNGCHGWTGTKVKGYGRISVDGKRRMVHAVMYEQMFGVIPNGRESHHVCENKGCINPLHILPVSHPENLWLSNPSQWSNESKKTHCPKGHPYSGENLMIRKHGYRVCRTCNTQRQRIAAAEKGSADQ